MAEPGQRQSRASSLLLPLLKMLTPLCSLMMLVQASAFRSPLIRSVRGSLVAVHGSSDIIDQMSYSELRAECVRLAIGATGNEVVLMNKDPSVFCF